MATYNNRRVAFIREKYKGQSTDNCYTFSHSFNNSFLQLVTSWHHIENHLQHCKELLNSEFVFGLEKRR